jgi:tRNA modification GTPase
MKDTIVALATPTGRSGIGVVRLSGPDSLAIIAKFLSDGNFSPVPRFCRLGKLHEPETRDLIDEAIITYFKAPHSFTGEDIVEISCHGSPLVLRRVVDACLRLGARLAEAGEYTLRAVANGRIDLTEAEAIRDLINAQTTASARQAIRQLRGEFSHELQPVKDELLNVIVVLESALEFVEDDLPDLQVQSLVRRLRSISAELRNLASTFKAGRLIREGLKVVIVGRPNVGKSSLFNALLGTDRAIVTEIAGTTRDQLHERLTIGDIPISLIDTAGLRHTEDTVESIGVDRSRRSMADADIVIVVFDAAEPVNDEDLQILSDVSELEHLVVFNKIDLVETSVLSRRVKDFVRQSGKPRQSLVNISALTGSGLSELEAAIIRPFSDQSGSNDGFLVTDARHHDLLTRSSGEIEHSIDLMEKGSSEEIVLIGLHNAMRYLGEITGETTTEDMLTRIFSTFCIGK